MTDTDTRTDERHAKELRRLAATLRTIPCNDGAFLIGSEIDALSRAASHLETYAAEPLYRPELTPGERAVPTMEAVRETISNEWGSHLCWRSGVNFDRTCDKDKHCRCADIARAVISQHTLSTPPVVAGADRAAVIETHKLDTHGQVFFYEQDFYVLSNFSAFNVVWRGIRFQTSEHAYHFERFWNATPQVTAGMARDFICNTTSAHEAFRYAQDNKGWQRQNWDEVKVDAMRDILREKSAQHEYVRRKLLATGDRELIEDSWRDDFWGWGPNRDGKNMLGKLWMEVRSELRAALVDAGKVGEGK
jgi:ribA/ribD-fused uncharacterized protein